jgi:hypothetical protein
MTVPLTLQEADASNFAGVQLSMMKGDHYVGGDIHGAIESEVSAEVTARKLQSTVG